MSESPSLASPTSNLVAQNLPLPSGTFEDKKDQYEATDEYSSQNGLEMIKASSAYARGATGQGVLIGIMDSGVDTSHQELNGSNKFTTDSYLTYQSRSPSTEEKRHGTHVSAIAAGERDGSGMHGVAFNASLFFISIELSDPPEDYDPVTIDSTVDFTAIDDAWSSLESYFTEKGVTAVNGSFGYQGNINDYNEVDLRYAFPKTIAVLAQEGTEDSSKTIFVWSAGNAGAYADEGVDYSSPEVFAGMAYLLPELQGHSVAVVALDVEGTIANYSSRCGVAKDYCIAAPGSSIYSAYTQDNIVTGYARWNGTSMAAPHVSGGIALLKDFFDGQLGNTEILSRLFLTADKSGIYANSEIYGQGLMDLDAATMPIGQTSIATINSLTSLVFPTSLTSVGFVSGFVGDGLSKSLNKNFIILDELGAPFYRNLQTTSINTLPSLKSLSYRYTNPSLRVHQVNRELTDNTFLTLGLNQLNYGEYESAPSLWAKEKEKVNYFSFKKYFSNESFYFLGQGVNPSLFLGFSQERKLLNQFFGSEENASPFLNFSKEGSFFGAGKSISNRSSISGVFFSGKHPDLIYFPNHNKKSSGLVFEYQALLDKQEVSFQSGVLSESSAMLGSSFRGAYGRLDDTLTYFSGLNSSFIFSNFRLMGSYFYGMSKPDLEQKGMVKDISRLTSSSFNLSLYKAGLLTEADSFGFSISQPLKLESGEINFSLPYRRTVKKEILFNDFSASMGASGRQVDMEFIYSTPIRNGYLKSRIGVSKDQGHISSKKLQPFFETSWEFMKF